MLFFGRVHLLLLLPILCRSAFDLPLKKCPTKTMPDGNSVQQVADPNWMQVRYAFNVHDENYRVPWEFDNNYDYCALLESPYSSSWYGSSSARRTYEVGRLYLNTLTGRKLPELVDIFTAYEDYVLKYPSAEDEYLDIISKYADYLRDPRNQWTAADGYRMGELLNQISVYESVWKTMSLGRPMAKFDTFSSAVFLGDRHVAVSTRGNAYPNDPTSSSMVGRVILLDVENFGTTSQSAVMPYSKDKAIPVVHGCHADSYAEETLVGRREPSFFPYEEDFNVGKVAPLQSFYMVCMVERSDKTILLTSLTINIHTYPQRYVLITGRSKYSSAQYIANDAVVSDPGSYNSFVPTLHTFPVHVVGKRTVLYRCQKQFPGVAGVAHWCWRNFDVVGGWKEEKPALTDAALEPSVLQKGMFIGWSGKENLVNNVNSTRLYFLDRLSRRLFTLYIDDSLNTIRTNALTGIYPDIPTSMMNQSQINSTIRPSNILYYYGQVNHFHDTLSWWDSTQKIPTAVDEELYLASVGTRNWGESYFYRYCLRVCKTASQCVSSRFRRRLSPLHTACEQQLVRCDVDISQVPPLALRPLQDLQPTLHISHHSVRPVHQPADSVQSLQAMRSRLLHLQELLQQSQ